MDNISFSVSLSIFSFLPNFVPNKEWFRNQHQMLNWCLQAFPSRWLCWCSSFYPKTPEWWALSCLVKTGRRKKVLLELRDCVFVCTGMRTGGSLFVPGTLVIFNPHSSCRCHPECLYLLHHKYVLVKTVVLECFWDVITPISLWIRVNPTSMFCA